MTPEPSTVTTPRPREFSQMPCQQVDGLQNRNTVAPPAAQVVDLSRTRRLIEFQKQVGHVVRVNLVADLLSFVAVHLVLLPGHGADDDIRQIAVQFDGGMLRPGEAPAAT